MSKGISPLISAREKLKLIDQKSLTPTENISNCLKQIDLVNPSINALTYIERVESVAMAASLTKITQLKGQSRGRLHGLTFSAKDHFYVKGMPASEGSKQTLVSSAPFTEDIITLLINEGAVCLGKGNQPEYGKSNFTENSLYGRTNNPWDLEFTSGGSTGGDAAAVASGCVDLGIGGDSGGSLRVPANFCGVFGLLPSPGLIKNNQGVFINNSFLKTMGSLGPLARSLDDLELLFEVLLESSNAAPKREIESNNRTKKFIYCTNIAGVPCNDEILSTLKSSISRFEALGYKGKEVNHPLFDAAIPIFYLLAGHAGLVQEDLIRSKIGISRDPSLESPTIAKLREQVNTLMPPLTIDSLLEGMYGWEKIKRDVDLLFNECDFILSPVAATSTLKHTESTVTISGQDRAIHELFHFARFANVLGLPALSFPTELSSSAGKGKIPLGLQVITKKNYDSFLFSLLKDAEYCNQVNP